MWPPSLFSQSFLYHKDHITFSTEHRASSIWGCDSTFKRNELKSHSVWLFTTYLVPSPFSPYTPTQKCCQPSTSSLNIVMAIILEDKEEVTPRGHEDPGVAMGKVSPLAFSFLAESSFPDSEWLVRIPSQRDKDNANDSDETLSDKALSCISEPAGKFGRI